MALTPFGKALRKIRIDSDMLLKDMADGLGVSPTFMSAVESGRKPIPGTMLDQIRRFLHLDEATLKELRRAADESVSAVTLKLSNNASGFDRSLATQLARNFDELNQEQKDQIQQILSRRK
jgi:transcriptional regulator with XRE-family HTH domain